MMEESLCVVSGVDIVRFRSNINHAAFARANNLACHSHVGAIHGLKSHYYLKLELVRRMLEHYEWILWLDDDAFFTNFDDRPLQSLLDEAKAARWSFVIGDSPVAREHPFWTRFNSGVFLVRRAPETLELLSKALSVDPHAEPAAWWREQDGSFFGSDQDSLLWAIETLDCWPSVGVVDHGRINSRRDEYLSSLTEHFVVHFPGLPNRDHAIDLFAARFELDDSLTPPALQVAAGFTPQPPLTRRSARRRFVRRHPRSAVRSVLDRLDPR